MDGKVKNVNNTGFIGLASNTVASCSRRHAYQTATRIHKSVSSSCSMFCIVAVVVFVIRATARCPPAC